MLLSVDQLPYGTPRNEYKEPKFQKCHTRNDYYTITRKHLFYFIYLLFIKLIYYLFIKFIYFIIYLISLRVVNYSIIISILHPCISNQT